MPNGLRELKAGKLFSCTEKTKLYKRNSFRGCVLQKNFRQSRKYFQYHRMQFDEQNLLKIITAITSKIDYIVTISFQ